MDVFKGIITQSHTNINTSANLAEVLQRVYRPNTWGQGRMETETQLSLWEHPNKRPCAHFSLSIVLLIASIFYVNHKVECLICPQVQNNPRFQGSQHTISPSRSSTNAGTVTEFGEIQNSINPSTTPGVSVSHLTQATQTLMVHLRGTYRKLCSKPRPLAHVISLLVRLQGFWKG